MVEGFYDPFAPPPKESTGEAIDCPCVDQGGGIPDLWGYYVELSV